MTCFPFKDQVVVKTNKRGIKRLFFIFLGDEKATLSLYHLFERFVGCSHRVPAVAPTGMCPS